MIHVNNALNLGLTADEISELLVHVGVYAGVSTWHNGTNIARYVFIERGILEAGPGIRPVSSPPTGQEDRRLNAEKVKTALACGKIGLGDDAADLAPLPGSPRGASSTARLAIEDEIAQIQSEYAYGEVWSRPAIDLRTRMLVTVAVLQALRLSTQLHAHINMALNIGVTPEELHEVFLHAGVYSGLAGWQNAVDVARDVFIQRGVLPTTEPK
jgi:4-carboxymuconolactone decarboxylase